MTHTAEGDAATSVISTRRGLLGASFAGAALSLIAGHAAQRLHWGARQRRRPRAAHRSSSRSSSPPATCTPRRSRRAPMIRCSACWPTSTRRTPQGIAGFVGEPANIRNDAAVRRARIGVRRVRPNCGRDRRLRPRVGRGGHPHSRCWRASRTSTAPSWSRRCWRWRPAIASSSPTCPAAATTSTSCSSTPPTRSCPRSCRDRLRSRGPRSVGGSCCTPEGSPCRSARSSRRAARTGRAAPNPDASATLPTSTPLPAGEVDDVVLLRTAQSLEHTALDAYAAARSLDVLSAEQDTLVQRFVDDHTGHSVGPRWVHHRGRRRGVRVCEPVADPTRDRPDLRGPRGKRRPVARRAQHRPRRSRASPPRRISRSSDLSPRRTSG